MTTGDRAEYVSSYILFAAVALISLGLLLLTYRINGRVSRSAAAGRSHANHQQLAA